MESVTISVEVYKENGQTFAWIATETGSGCKYAIDETFTPGDALNEFINEDDPDEFSFIAEK